VIDALQNLTTGDFDSQREANIERANRIKNICDRLNVAIMTTVEILKREQNERPTLSSIMESGKYGYNASLVWALWEDPNGPQDDPERINLQLIYLKNKLSFFKGFQTLLFEKSVSKMTEIETHDFQMKPEKQNKKEHGKKKNDY
jgi:replicative DNA helicase